MDSPGSREERMRRSQPSGRRRIQVLAPCLPMHPSHLVATTPRHKPASHLDIPVLVSRTLGDGREASTATPMDLGPTGGEPLTLVSVCAHVRLPIPASHPPASLPLICVV